MRRNEARDSNWLKSNKRVKFIDWNLQLFKSSCSENPKGLIIQTTNAPLLGQSLGELIPALIGFQGVFIDLVYGSPSALHEFCRARDLLAFDGIPMLIGQALLAQRFWWAKAADYDEIEKALRKYMRG
jgi:shikimate 5-dehydrogenase